MPLDEKLAFLDAIDWKSKAQVLPDGRRSYLIDLPARAIPFTVPCQFFRRLVGPTADAAALDLSGEAGAAEILPFDQRVIDDSGDGVELDPDATGDTGSDDEVALAKQALLSGVASSTSVDFFGTEMSLRALKRMAVQMMRGSGMAIGIPYVPRHNRGFDAMEWDEVIGRTVHAEVVPVEAVANAANNQESQFLLRVTIRLNEIPANPAERDESEKAIFALIKRLDRGEAIGQSIGGWFTRIEIIEDSQGNVERIIVHEVDLDHLAVTRAPANPDSGGLMKLRARAAEILRGLLTGQPGERHLLATQKTEHTVIHQYLRAGSGVDDLDPGESIEEGGDGDDSEAVDLSDAYSEDDDDRAAPPPSDPSTPDPGSRAESGSDTIRDDAHRSATGPPPATDSPVDNPSEERPMSVTIEEMRALFTEKVDPLAERIAALEAQRSNVNPEPEPLTLEEQLAAMQAERDAARAALAQARAGAPALAPAPAELTPEQKLAAMQAERDAAVARADRAESVVQGMASGGYRVGRSAAGFGVPRNPFTASTVYDGIIERCKAEAPNLATACTRGKALLLGPAGDLQRHASYAELNSLLVAICNTAEIDAVITPPAQRAAWS